jgi:phage terminase large subunit GpA-like protein
MGSMSVPTLKKSKTTNFKSISDITRSLLRILQPPERLSVSQCAAKYRKLNNPGAYVGPWKNETAPYLVQPMDMLTSREHDGLIFVAPAQSGKTDALMLNWTAYSIKSDPMDIMIYSPTGAAARDFSLRRVDRLNRHSPEIGGLLSRSRDSDNRLDKHYRTGTMLSLSHPSQTELAGKPVPRVGLTDFDRMPDDIDGDGNAYDLASKRTTTFGSYAMCAAESSPSKPIEDMQWIASSAHEAPPAKGIFALYNRGDKRRWYWPCPHCGKYFEGEWDHLRWDTKKPSDLEQAESVYMACPISGCIIDPDERYDMNIWGVWLRDGEYFGDDGLVTGVGQRTLIVSYWLKGVAAAFTTWTKLVSTYIAALREYEKTKSEEALKKFYNNDLCLPYIPKSAETMRYPELLKARAQDLGERVVPPGVRFLIGCVDVQKSAFVVQIHGVYPGQPCDLVIVDRFTIHKSTRVDEDGDVEWVKPHAYLEDWDVLIEKVITSSYFLGDDSGRRMAVKYTLCDSGGKAGVTAKAYDFYRSLRKRNLHGRFHLVKGEKKPDRERSRISYPDAEKKDRSAAARGDVPVLLLNSNVLKDELNGRLDCVQPGSGMISFPNWLEDWFFLELCAEIRTHKGWENPPHTRNEAWDLLYYLLGLFSSKIFNIEKINWLQPPSWAAEWDSNDMVSQPGAPERFAPQAPKEYDLSEIAADLA